LLQKSSSSITGICTIGQKWPQYQELRYLGTQSHPTNNKKIVDLLDKICDKTETESERKKREQKGYEILNTVTSSMELSNSSAAR
jgi:hypothetical protein